MLPSTDNIKMRQAIWNKNQTMPSWQEQAREKGAQWVAESNTIRVKNFRPTRQPGGSKYVILCFLANMRYELEASYRYR